MNTNTHSDHQQNDHSIERDHDHQQHGHNDHHAHMIEEFKKRFWISLVLTVPVLILSPMIQSLLGVSWGFTGDRFVLFGLSSAAFFYGGWPFLKGLYDELKDKNPGMMTLIAVAIGVAYFYSSAVVFGLTGKMFFWELVTLIDIMLLGHWIEMKSVMGASRALELLVNMMPSEAHLVEGKNTRDIALKEVRPGDLLLVKPGEKIPADATITQGESHVNESMLTGESVPVKKGTHDQVIGGAINGNSSITIQVLHTGEASYLNKVITLVQQAQKTKSKTQNLANKAAKWLTYIALSAGFGTMAVWLLLGYDFVFALERMVTVMVISCPHALGLAVPLVVAISTSLSAQNGLLIRNRTAFENARKITVLVFDKTGTLTKGEFGVTRFQSIDDQYSDKEILIQAAALERDSEHPIALGILNKAKGLSEEVPKAHGFSAITGKGVKAKVHDKEVLVVSPGYLRDEEIVIPKQADGNAAETVVFVLIEGRLVGFIALADEVRPESKDAISLFQKEKIKVMMATGDNEKVAKSVSEQLGLDGYYAEVLPHQKVEIVKELQEQGQFVAMTGDGVNDAPALAQADVGIAVGSGTDVAAETADIILVNSNPQDIAKLIFFGKATYEKMIQNLIWATGYNAVAIPLAAGVLYGVGFVLSPAVGAVFMSLSTVIVAINAQLLKKQVIANIK
ncbi:MAG: copper-translocating P-type ATPase [Cyclobacteriaceae bacterium]